LRYFEALNNQNDVAAHISLEYNKQGFCWPSSETKFDKENYF
jgi:hypothetical protein